MWCQLQTQWRYSMNGPTGLDYTAVIAFLKVQDLDEPLTDILELIAACELETLQVLAEVN